MKPLSASQAAKAVGKSIPTITRAIKSGKLSATKLPDGKGYEIDPSELFRVWPSVTSKDDASQTMSGSETSIETRILEVKLQALEKENNDLRANMEAWRNQAEQLMLKAPAQDNAPAAAEKPVQRLGLISGAFAKLGL
jgi:hypothetical protein